MSPSKPVRNLITITLPEDIFAEFNEFHLKYINQTGDTGMRKATLIKLALIHIMGEPKGISLLKQTKRKIFLLKKKK